MLPDPSAPCFFDLSDRAKLRVRGPDAARYLQGQLTNDVRRAAREVVYACLLTAKGRLVADVYLRAEGEGYLLDADASLRETLAARLDRYIIADDVTVEDVTDELGLLHFPGGVQVEHLVDKVASLPQLADVDRLGQPGTDVFGVPSLLETLKVSVQNAGLHEAPPADAETRRIAAGVPRWGAELGEDTLPPEAGLETRAISYDKGCYVGQETVSRLKSIGHVNRHLRRLRGAGPAPLTAGLRLHEPGGPADPATAGREVGRVTSAAGNLALGYVRRGHEAEGTRLLALDPADPTVPPREVEVAGLPYASTP